MFFYQQTAEGAEERQYHSREVFTVRTSISEHFSVRRKQQQESTKNTGREIKAKKGATYFNLKSSDASRALSMFNMTVPLAMMASWI